jgi:hypothetical protein
MKTFYKWFDYFLTLLFVSSIVATGVVIYIAVKLYNSGWGQYVNKEGFILAILLLTSFIFGLLYIIVGIILLIIKRGKQNADKRSVAKRLIFRGTLRSCLAFVVFFILSLALSFFGLKFERTHLPVLGDPNSPHTGFPIKDLKIIYKKPDAEDSTLCYITVLNTNPKLSAANVSVMDGGAENDYVFMQEHITPGKTDNTRVGGNTKNPATL